MLVNEELGELVAGLLAAEALLERDGRLVVVAFHSLEDRIVKSFLAARSRPPASSRHRPEPRRADATFRVLTRRPVVPDQQEIDANPRARSARLRAAARTAAPAAALDATGLLPGVPSLAEVLGRRAAQRGPTVRRR
jgi:16S rRNA (cytosine1402-N4)-methyltransferase